VNRRPTDVFAGATTGVALVLYGLCSFKAQCCSRRTDLARIPDTGLRPGIAASVVGSCIRRGSERFVNRVVLLRHVAVAVSITNRNVVGS
jgi:hypothetical protein